MGNRYSVMIHFGGDLPASALDDLAEAINDDNADPDWGGCASVEDAKAQLLANQGETLYFGAHECNWGRMDAIESVLQQNGIAYYIDADGDGSGEISRYRDVWTPDATLPELGVMTSIDLVGDSPAIGLDDLKRLKAEGKGIDEAIAKLTPYAPQLAPFKII